MKPRWAPRWFTYVGLGPNPALPRPVGDSMPEPTYVYLAFDRRHTSTPVVFKTEHFAKQWILNLLKDSQHWEIHSCQVHEDEE
jgi:hypothetical protein